MADSRSYAAVLRHLRTLSLIALVVGLMSIAIILAAPTSGLLAIALLTDLAVFLVLGIVVLAVGQTAGLSERTLSWLVVAALSPGVALMTSGTVALLSLRQGDLQARLVLTASIASLASAGITRLRPIWLWLSCTAVIALSLFADYGVTATGG